MNITYKTNYLLIAGLIMMLVGSYIAITTVDYLAAMTAEDIEPSINMLSDLRGMGGMLLILGFYLFVSAFKKAWQTQALLLATVVYLSFVIFRSLSFVVDGLPEMTILVAYLIEALLAALGVLLLSRCESRAVIR